MTLKPKQHAPSRSNTVIRRSPRRAALRADDAVPGTLQAASASNRQMLRFVAAQRVQRQPEEDAPAAATPASEPQADKMTPQDRMAYVMGLLVDKYHYPELGAAGLVGNLCAESKVLPNIIEGGSEKSPMKGPATTGGKQEFTPEEVMNRKPGVSGPHKPGVGLAQWTSAKRRAGLFQHSYNGQVLGAAILFSLDAQVDYLVKELEGAYKGVNKVLMAAESVDVASDEMVFNFERPQAVLKDKTDTEGNVVYKTKKDKQGKLVDVLDKQGNKVAVQAVRSRTDPAVLAVLKTRRAKGQEALAAYRTAKGKQPTGVQSQGKQ